MIQRAITHRSKPLSVCLQRRSISTHFIKISPNLIAVQLLCNCGNICAASISLGTFLASPFFHFKSPRQITMLPLHQMYCIKMFDNYHRAFVDGIQTQDGNVKIYYGCISCGGEKKIEMSLFCQFKIKSYWIKSLAEIERNFSWLFHHKKNNDSDVLLLIWFMVSRDFISMRSLTSGLHFPISLHQI